LACVTFTGTLYGWIRYHFRVNGSGGGFARSLQLNAVCGCWNPCYDCLPNRVPWLSFGICATMNGDSTTV